MIGELCLSGCDCVPTVGFDQSVWPGVSACGGITVLTNMSTTNIGSLAQCKIIFAGNPGDACGPAIRFISTDWPAVKTYIENGGRLWISAEYEGCLNDPTNLASFLTAMGSSLSNLGGVYDGSCTVDGSRDCTPGVANIAQGLSSPFRMAATGELSGGTNVFLSPSGQEMVQVEQLGDGFLFLCGDSNVVMGNHGCDYSGNCEFLRRLWEYADGDII